MTEITRHLSLSRSLTLLCAAASLSACAADAGTPGAAASADSKSLGALLDGEHGSDEPDDSTTRGGASGLAGGEQTPEYDGEERAPEYNQYDQNPQSLARAYSQYFVLGDSFSAGTGTTPDKHDACFTSTSAWPYRLVTRLGFQAEQVIMGACSGAVTNTVLGQFMKDPFMAPTTDQNTLITVGIGGNDMHIVEELMNCASRSFDCTTRRSELEAILTNTLPTQLADVFGYLRQVAPQATIVAVGYPHIVAIPAEGAYCMVGIDRAEATMITELIDLMNATIAAAACAAGIDSVTLEIVQKYAGNEFCDSSLYLNTLDWTVNERTGHPTEAGNQAFGDAVFEGLSQLAYGNSNTCQSHPATQAATPTPVAPTTPAAAPVPAASPLPATAPIAAPAPLAQPVPATASVVPAPPAAALVPSAAATPGAVPLQRATDADGETPSNAPADPNMPEKSGDPEADGEQPNVAEQPATSAQSEDEQPPAAATPNNNTEVHDDQSANAESGE